MFIKNTLAVKKGGQDLKQTLLKKMKSNGQPMPPGHDRFESIVHDELTVKYCYFRCSRPPDVDVIKLFDKDDQLQNTVFYLNVLRPGHLYQKF